MTIYIDISDHPDLDQPILYNAFTGKFGLCILNQAHIDVRKHHSWLHISMNHWIFGKYKSLHIKTNNLKFNLLIVDRLKFNMIIILTILPHSLAERVLSMHTVYS